MGLNRGKRMKQIILATTSAFILAMAACSGPAEDAGTSDEAPDTSETADAGTEPVEDPASQETGAVDALQIIRLDCGSIYVSDLDIFSTAGDYAGQTDTLTDTCWLVRHPDGNLLWDLGLPGILTSQDEQTTGVFTVSLEETIGSQLDAMDLANHITDIANTARPNTSLADATVSVAGFPAVNSDIQRFLWADFAQLAIATTIIGLLSERPDHPVTIGVHGD